MDLTNINHVIRDMDAEIQTASDRLADTLSRQDIDRIHAAAAHLHALLATWRRYRASLTQLPPHERLPQERDARIRRSSPLKPSTFPPSAVTYRAVSPPSGQACWNSPGR